MTNKIADARIGRILDTARQLSGIAKKNHDDFNAARLTFEIVSETGLEDKTAEDLKNIARLSARIIDEMPCADEPRFSMADYADAYANATDPVDISKLLALDGESFAAAMIWLATDKRETYEGTGHCQAPLEVDIR